MNWMPFDKAYPATMCKQTSGTTPIIYTGKGRVENDSTSKVNVVCPIVDNIESDGMVEGAEVVVRDQHYSQNVTCYYVQRSWNGKYNRYTRASTSGSTSSYQTLNLGSRPTRYSDGYSFIKCDLPATYGGNASEIVSYTVFQSQYYETFSWE